MLLIDWERKMFLKKSVFVNFPIFCVYAKIYSAFIKKELLSLQRFLRVVYVDQSPSFINSTFLSHVVKLKKVLDELKQASRAWYGLPSKFLL